jgi:hypothetical protein
LGRWVWGPESSCSHQKQNSKTDTEETYPGADLLMQSKEKVEQKCAFQPGGWSGSRSCSGCSKTSSLYWALCLWGWSVLENCVLNHQLLQTGLCIINSSYMLVWGVLGLGWSNQGHYFSQAAGLQISKCCCCMSQLVPLRSAVQDVIPYQPLSHHSQPSAFLTPCLTPISRPSLRICSHGP